MKKTILAASCVAAALLLAGCSAESETSGGSVGAVAEPNSGLPTQGENLVYDPNHLVNDGQPIELEWWMWDGDEVFQKFVDAYTEYHPNVSISILKQPWDDYWTKLPLALGGKDGPALFNVHNSQDANLSPYFAPYDVDLEALQKDYTGAGAHVQDGKVNYVDFGMMTGLIYYNKTMWEAAGLTESDVPQTWDQFREVAKKLTVREGDALVQAGFNYNDLYKEIGLGLPYQLGFNLMEPDMKTPDLDNTGMLENMNMFLDMYTVDGVGSKDFGLAATDSFGQGQSAMIYNWGHFAGTLSSDFPDIEYGTFRTPVHDADETPYAFDRYNGESTLGISNSASEAEQAVAQDFLLFYLTYEDGLKDLCVNYSLYPSYVPLQSDAELLENPVISALGEADRYIWPGPMPATFEDNIGKAYEEVIFNGVAPEEALATANDAVAADLKRSTFVSTEDLYEFYQPSPGQK